MLTFLTIISIIGIVGLIAAIKTGIEDIIAAAIIILILIVFVGWGVLAGILSDSYKKEIETNYKVDFHEDYALVSTPKLEMIQVTDVKTFNYLKTATNIVRVTRYNAYGLAISNYIQVQ